MARRTIYSVKFSFDKPKLLSESEFNSIRRQLPIYPQPEDVNTLVMKKYWGHMVLLLFPPAFAFMLVSFLISDGPEPYIYAKALRANSGYIDHPIPF